jgi:hypothetical protein
MASARLVERDAVAHDVDPEIAAEGELVVDVLQRVDDQRHRAPEAFGEIFLEEPILGLGPDLRIGQGLVVHDDEDIVVGKIAGGAILDRVAAGLRAEQDHLQDLAARLLGRELGRLPALEAAEEERQDALQLALARRRQRSSRERGGAGDAGIARTLGERPASARPPRLSNRVRHPPHSAARAPASPTSASAAF